MAASREPSLMRPAGFTAIFQDVAAFGFCAAAVPGRAHAQRPMRFSRQVSDCQSGHRSPAFRLQAMKSVVSS
jgi:hypothetical protein